MNAFARTLGRLLGVMAVALPCGGAQLCTTDVAPTRVPRSDRVLLELGELDGSGPMRIELPLEGVVHTLVLWPWSVRAPGFALLEPQPRWREDTVTTTSQAPDQASGAASDGTSGVASGPVPSPRTVRGEVFGQPGSFVAGSLLPDGFHGRVECADGRAFGVQPTAVPGEHAVETLPRRAHSARAAAAPVPLASAVFIADTDHDFFERHQRSPRAVIDDVELLTNLASSAYERDVGIRLLLARVVVRRDSQVPVYPSSDTAQILGTNNPALGMPGLWSDRYPSAVRDFVILFSDKDLRLDLGGLIFDVRGAAHLAGITLEAKRYGVIERLGGDVHAAVNLAHEIGHLWGADHCDEPCQSIMKGGTNLSTPLEFDALAIAQISARRDLLAGTPLGEANVVGRAVHEGSIVPGEDIRELDVSDDRPMRVDSAGRRLDLELVLASPVDSGGELDVIYEYHVLQSASALVDVEVSIFDWGAGTFVTVDSFRAGNEEFLRRLQIPEATRYFGSGRDQGQMRARVRAVNVSVLASSFGLELDVFRVRLP